MASSHDFPASMVATTVGLYLVGNLARPNATAVVVRMTYQDDPWYVWTQVRRSKEMIMRMMVFTPPQTPAWLFLNIMFATWFGVLFFLALLKLYLFVKEQKGFQFSVPQVCLGSSALAAALMVPTTMMDVHGSRGAVAYLTMV